MGGRPSALSGLRYRVFFFWKGLPLPDMWFSISEVSEREPAIKRKRTCHVPTQTD